MKALNLWSADLRNECCILGMAWLREFRCGTDVKTRQSKYAVVDHVSRLLEGLFYRSMTGANKKRMLGVENTFRCRNRQGLCQYMYAFIMKGLSMRDRLHGTTAQFAH
jgi:hypothetical protein